MLKEINLEEAKGKTIKDYLISPVIPQMVIIFTDGMFTTVGADTGYEQELPPELKHQELNVLGFGDRQLIRIGLLSEEELLAEDAAKHRRDKEHRDSIDRAAYERLKKKFEG